MIHFRFDSIFSQNPTKTAFPAGYTWVSMNSIIIVKENSSFNPNFLVGNLKANCICVLLQLLFPVDRLFSPYVGFDR